MFKSFKRKIAIMLSVILVTAVVPVTLLAEDAPAGGTPAFTQASLNSTSVAPGERLSFNLRTTGANYVFAIVNDEEVDAESHGEDSITGETAWSLHIYPTSSQTVRVHANVANNSQGAATVSIPVQVQAATAQAESAPEETEAATPAEAPAATPNQTGTHRIIDIEEIESAVAGAVTLRVTTDPQVQFVWITHPDNPAQVVGLANADDSGTTTGSRVSQDEDSAVWEISYRLTAPLNPHNIQIHANRAYVTDSNLTTETFSVELSYATAAAAPSAPANDNSGESSSSAAADGEDPAITRVSADRNIVAPGASAALTIRTSPNVNYVWVMVDDERVNATSRRAGSSATVRVWNVDVSPEETQNITVYANTTNSSDGAVTDNISLTVREIGDPRVNSVTSERTTISFGERVVLTVTTNQDVLYVWANIGSTREEGRLISSSGSQRRWELGVAPASRGANTIEVFGGTQNNNTANSDSRNIVITTIDQ